MVRHTGTRHQPIIAHCPKYRIEDTTPYDIDRESQEQWKYDTQTVNEPLIDSGSQNLLSNILDIVPLHSLPFSLLFYISLLSIYLDWKLGPRCKRDSTLQLWCRAWSM